MPDIAALILAAGGSSRMGQPKQLCQFNGTSFLRHTVHLAVAAQCAPILVVLQSTHGPIADELSGLPITMIENPDWRKGIGTSIRRGVTHLLNSDLLPSHLLIMLCDQPRVSADHLRQLTGAVRSNHKPICVSDNGTTMTPPICIAAEYFPGLLNIPDDQGAKFIWADRPDMVHRVYSAHAGTDIDTPEDYRTLLNPS